jgi:L-fuconolactonase
MAEQKIVNERVATEKVATEKIDAHHHLWHYSPAEYGWIDDRMSRLRRDFLPADLEKELHAAGLDGAVTVQARQSLEETEWLLSLTAASPFLRGVVGWAPIAAEQFPAELARLCQHKKLKGLRHVIQDEPDENYINGAAFNRGIQALQGSGLVYDIVIFDKHLAAAIEFVDRHPKQVFVLDHMAKPRIRGGVTEPWRTKISELARRENVYCKLSGLVTEADWTAWSEDGLRVYVDVALAAFGPRRMMVGSDWPVCLLATTYAKWFQTVEHLIGALSATEKERIWGGTAIEVYQLHD